LEDDLAEHRRNLAKEAVYNDSIFTTISQSDKFQNFTLGIIVCNAIWIGIDTEYNHKNLAAEDGRLPLQPGSTVVEHLFCGYFTIEVFIRFLAFRRKCSGLKDGWFVFDSILVFCMILETWIMEIVKAAGGGEGAAVLSNFSALRLMRLLRLTRMARLMQAVPELLMLVKGMISATKAVGFILIFLLLVMFVFAIVLMSILAEPGEFEPETAKYFCGSMGDTMMMLFTNGVLGDNLNATVAAILEEGEFPMWVFWVFFGISSMTLLNMLIGVLCEVIGKKAEEEKQMLGETEMRLTLGDAFAAMDNNGDGRVTAQEWELMKVDPNVRRSLAANGIEPQCLDEQLDKMQQAIFCAKVGGRKGNITGLSLEEFVTRLLDIQPSKAASVLELSILQSKFTMRDEKLQSYLYELEVEMNEMLEAQGKETVPIPSDVKTPKADKSEVGASNADEMTNLSTAALFEILKNRTSSNSSAPSPKLLQSAFPTSEPPVSDEMNEPEGITHEERVLARQHPLFQQLVGRKPPGGWAQARLLAEKLSKKRLSLFELSLAAKKSVTDLESLLDAMPELFEKKRLNENVNLRNFEEHVHGCPRHPLSSGTCHDVRCQCVWRLCDALHLFTRGSAGRSLGSAAEGVAGKQY
jgi:voltage-gated sodium channel